MKIEYYDKYNNETFELYKIMQFPIPHDLIKDCYTSFDAPSEFKLLFLEKMAEEFDKLIMNEAPIGVDKWTLMDKLSKIEIKYKDAR